MAERAPIFTVRNIAIAMVALILLGVAHHAWKVQYTLNTLADDSFGNYIGPKDAKNVIVELMDYRCHACRTMTPVLEAFSRRNPDVKIVFRDFPLYEQTSIREGRLSLAAGKQGKFLAMHDYLMSRENAVEDQEIPDIAKDLGLDFTKLQADMQGRDVNNRLLDTLDAMDLLYIRNAPSFLFNHAIYIPPGNMPAVDQFENLYRPYKK